jgi:hypothetical protein
MENSKVYFISDGKYIKIGVTKQNIYDRIKQLKTGNGNRIFLLGWIKGDRKKEKELHRQFIKLRLRQNTEWFHPGEELLSYINTNNEEITKFVVFENNTVSVLFRLKKVKTDYISLT